MCDYGFLLLRPIKIQTTWGTSFPCPSHNITDDGWDQISHIKCVTSENMFMSLKYPPIFSFLIRVVSSHVFLFVYFTGVPITWAPFTLSGVTCLFRLIILNRRNDVRLQRQYIMNYLFSQRKSKASDIPTLYFVVPWLWEKKKKNLQGYDV